jgi:hypothetical protein
MVRKNKSSRLGQVGPTTQTDSRKELYVIEWLDAYEHYAGWHSLKDAKKIRPKKVLSVGYVLEENKDYVILAADIGLHKDTDVGRLTVIPGQWIIKKVKVK